MKHYLLELITACVPDQKFGQDAIEWALLTGRFVLTGDKEADVKNIMRFYDDIIEANRRQVQETGSNALGKLRAAVSRN